MLLLAQGLFYHANTTRHNYSTNVDQVKFGKGEEIETRSAALL